MSKTIISIHAHKGGSGKTTGCHTLGTGFGRQGAYAFIMQTDNRKIINVEDRPYQILNCDVTQGPANLNNALQAFAQYDMGNREAFAIIDTKATDKDAELNVQTSRLSHVAIITMKYSGEDIREGIDTFNLITEARKRSELVDLDPNQVYILPSDWPVNQHTRAQADARLRLMLESAGIPESRILTPLRNSAVVSELTFDADDGFKIEREDRSRYHKAALRLVNEILERTGLREPFPNNYKYDGSE